MIKTVTPEAEGDLVMAADQSSIGSIAFMTRNGSRIILLRMKNI
jgi:3,4-dihydroxy-2-butanone 4-phosphate synthase